MKRTSPETLSQQQLDAVVHQVRRERGVALRALGLGKLTRAAEAELLAVLGRAGLEHTGKFVRVPVREQAREAVTRAGELGIAEAALAREVKGARNAAEVRLVVAELIREGLLASFVDGRVTRIAVPSPRLLADAELDQLTTLAQQLGALAKATKPAKNKPRPTLARAALEGPLEALSELAKARDTSSVHGALRAAFLVAPATSGLVRVPDVIRALERVHPRSALVAATTSLAREGVLELRPEASIGRIAEDDRARCPVALDGTPLSYARMKAEGVQA